MDALSSLATFLLASLEAPEVISLVLSPTSAVGLADTGNVLDGIRHTVGGVLDGLHCDLSVVVLVWVEVSERFFEFGRDFGIGKKIKD